MTNKLIGLVEVCGSMAYKITGDAHTDSGLGKYESKDFFLSVKGQCMPADYEELSAELSNFAQSMVMGAANYHANFLLHPTASAPEVPASAGVVESNADKIPGLKDREGTEPPTTTAGPYVVAEKAPEQGTQPPPATTKPQRPSAIIAERLKAAGMTADELMQWSCKYFQSPAGTKFKQEQYVEAFTKAEEFLKNSDLATLRTVMAAAEPAPVNTSNLPIGQVAAKFPMWPPDLCRLGAMWCVDQVKDAGALEAFLIAGGVNSNTPHPRIESYLAITRHLAMSAGANLLEYSRKSGAPLGQIEDGVSQIVGQPIRFASGLAPETVANALTEYMKGKS